MRPIFLIDLNGQDITEALEPFAPEVSWTDSVDDTVDELTLTVVDGGRMPLPQKNAEITLFAGYAETGLERVGKYFFRSPQSTRHSLTLTCSAVPAGNATHISKAHEETTIGTIAEGVATNAGLEPTIDGAIGGIEIEHIAQRDESGIAFLARLVSDYGGALKFGDGKLAVVRRGAGTSVSGSGMSATIDAHNIIGDYSYSETDGFTEAEATTYDYEKAERKAVKAKASPEKREATAVTSPDAPGREGEGAVADNIEQILKYVQ